MGRLEDKVAVVVGGGQTPGESIGNGRATALRFAQEGAFVVVLDRDLDVMEEGVTAEEPKTRDSETHYITVKIENIQTPHEAPR